MDTHRGTYYDGSSSQFEGHPFDERTRIHHVTLVLVDFVIWKANQANAWSDIDINQASFRGLVGSSNTWHTRDRAEILSRWRWSHLKRPPPHYLYVCVCVCLLYFCPRHRWNQSFRNRGSTFPCAAIYRVAVAEWRTEPKRCHLA